MSKSWSQRVEQRYALRMPPDLRAWLDEQPWNQAGGAEFQRANSPEQLLEPEPGVIWSGFMLPDTLPLVGNDYGDWLCLRVTADGRIAEILHWSHCGGDWIPYGRSLAEALLYDQAARVLRPRRPAERPPLPEGPSLAWAEWAARWVPGSPAALRILRSAARDPGVHGQPLLEALGQAQIASDAVSRDIILRALDCPLKTRGDATVSQRLGFAWEPDFVRWLFDTSQIDAPTRRRLADHFQLAPEQLLAQDWDVAARVARAVVAQRTDLGWAFDVAGWAAERRHDHKQAIHYYLGGVQTSLFSDHAVLFRSHWFEEGYGKFAAARLAALKHHLSHAHQKLPYLNLLWENDLASVRSRVQQFWLRQAHQSLADGDHRRAYLYYYRAGWDVGLNLIDAYGEILDGLQRAALGIGSNALANLATLHRRFLP